MEGSGNSGIEQLKLAPAGASARRRDIWPLLAAGLLTLTFLTLPPPPLDNDADPSLSAVLNYAHQHGLQFGTEVIHTYGPLGFLIFPYFFPHAVAARIACNVFLCLTVAAGLCLVGWRLRLLWRYLLLGSFIWVAANLEPRTDLVFDIGLLCWGLLCFVESGRKLVVCALILTALAAFGALAKTSFLFSGGLTVILVAAEMWTRTRRLLALGMLTSFSAEFLLGWVLMGQRLLHLASFMANSWAILQAYNQASGWEGLDATVLSGFVLLGLTMAIVILRTLSSSEALWWRQSWLLVWTGLLTFAIWKHGYVRADAFHVVFFFAFATLLALALEIFPCARPAVQRWARTLCLASCLLSFLTLQVLFFPSLLHSLSQPFRAFGSNLCSLIKPAAYAYRMTEIIETRRRESQLPKVRQIIGGARADVFGRYQAYAVYNDLNYHPRPVFQSPAAGNEQLMRLNEQFYLSAAAPQSVLFDLEPTDRKFPPLEDALVLRDYLINYELVASEEPFLLLHARSSNAPRLTLLRSGTVGPGQPIDLRDYGNANLWLEIDLQPNLAGRLRQFLYRPPIVRLAAWHKPGKELIIRRRAPAPMLAVGFVASPLLLRNQDLLSFYSGNGGVSPGAYSVELLPGEEHWWQGTVHFRIYRIEKAGSESGL